MFINQEPSSYYRGLVGFTKIINQKLKIVDQVRGGFPPHLINFENMYCVYIIRSKKDQDLYIGSTNDLKRRLAEHNNGLVFSTKNRKPFELIYCEVYKVESDARKREHNLKLRANALNQLKRRISASLS